MKRMLCRLGAVLLALTMLVTGALALTVEEAIQLLEEQYIQELPPEAYEAETLDELFEALGDPYTYYMTEEAYQSFLAEIEKTVELIGIGVSIQYTDRGILVMEALEGGSAKAAGIQAGDLITAIDGTSCVPANEGHRDLILGKEGTEVTVTVRRGNVSRDYTLKRTRVVIPNTEVSVVDGHIGLVECSSFGSATGALFLEGIQAHNDEVDTWLVDLRGNLGGVSSAAVDALGVFAGAGFHLYLRDSAGQLYYYLYAEEAATDHPLVVLVNGSTASASEAFAAGVRDLGRGIVVGSRTYGKGVAQIILDEENYPQLFSGDGLKLTAYRFYSVGGITNDKIGVIPTLLVPDEYAAAIAQSLCGAPEAEQKDLLAVILNGQRLTLDRTALEAPALSALLEALPPSAILGVYLEDLDLWYDDYVPEIAEMLELSYDSRWFCDVAESAFAHELNTLATYRVVQGDGKGSFFPGETLKRGEVCTMLANVLGLKGGSGGRFTDVAPDAWYADAVNAMADLGLVQGAGSGMFYPESPLTQQEYFTILSRVARYLSVNYDYAAANVTEEQLAAAAELGFAGWARNGAVLLDMAGAMKLSGPAAEPSALILREEAAASLYAVLAGLGIIPE